MGRVYKAEQSTLGRTVAVKVIHPHLLGDEQTVARFYQEARASSRLNHPNSVSIIDFGLMSYLDAEMMQQAADIRAAIDVALNGQDIEMGIDQSTMRDVSAASGLPKPQLFSRKVTPAKDLWLIESEANKSVSMMRYLPCVASIRY